MKSSIPNWKKTRAFVWERDKGICGFCNEPVLESERWEIDHRIPKSEDGTHDLDNLRVSHYRCNRAAGAQLAGKHRREGRPLRVFDDGASTTIRFPYDVWAGIKQLAEAEGRTFQGQVLWKVRQFLATREKV